MDELWDHTFIHNRLVNNGVHTFPKIKYVNNGFHTSHNNRWVYKFKKN